jgi:hypothetical protein
MPRARPQQPRTRVVHSKAIPCPLRQPARQAHPDAHCPVERPAQIHPPRPRAPCRAAGEVIPLPVPVAVDRDVVLAVTARRPLGACRPTKTSDEYASTKKHGTRTRKSSATSDAPETSGPTSNGASTTRRRHCRDAVAGPPCGTGPAKPQSPSSTIRHGAAPVSRQRRTPHQAFTNAGSCDA